MRFVQRRSRATITASPDQISDRGLRPGFLRQPVGRHLVARPHAPLPRDRRALCRHGRRALARLLLRQALGNEARTNYALRETVLAERRKNPGGSTAISCCGANPGMVSWFVKQALVNLATISATRRRSRRPKTNGRACAAPRRQGRAYRRARHPAREEPEAAQRVRQHLVGRGLPVGRHAAGRTRLGHA